MVENLSRNTISQPHIFLSTTNLFVNYIGLTYKIVECRQCGGHLTFSHTRGDSHGTIHCI